MQTTAVKVEEPKGKLGVLLVGLGAVSSTFVAGRWRVLTSKVTQMRRQNG